MVIQWFKDLWRTIPPWNAEVTAFFLGSWALTVLMYLIAMNAGWVPWAWPAPIDFAGVWFNFASVGLAARQNRWTWVFGIPAVIFVAIIVAYQSLYGSMVLNLIYFLPLQFIGLLQWKYGGENRTELKVGWLKLWQWFALAVVGGVAWYLVYLIHVAVGGQVSIADSAILVFSILAQWLMNTKRVESWLFWIAVNGFSVYTYMITVPVLGLQYALFLLFAFYGGGSWILARYGKTWNDVPQLVNDWVKKRLRLA